ncbi:hypothetical protein Tco_0525719 [Tanacetum coccineum]
MHMANMEFCDKHNMVAFLQKPTGSEEFHQIVDFLAGSHLRYALTTNPTIYVSLIEQFWQTVTVESVNNEEQQITVTVDGHTFAITEASVRRHLQLAYADGISLLHNTEIFEQLTQMGKKLLKQHKKTYVAPTLSRKLFSNMKIGFSGEHTPLFDTMIPHDQPGQGEGPTLTVESQHTPIASPTTSQPTTTQPTSSQEQPSHIPITEPILTTSSPPLHETTFPQKTSFMPHDSPLSGGYTPGSDKGSKKLTELTELCTKLFDKVTSLEQDLKQTKQVYGKAITKLVNKVKHLEDRLKSTTARRKAKLVISDEEEDLVLEDPSKQGRMSDTEYEEAEYDLDQTDTFAAKLLAEASKERVKTYNRRRRSTDSLQVSTTAGIFSTAEDIQDTDKELARKFDQERKEADDIDWSKIVEQAQERQSGSMIRYQALKKKPVTVAQARKNMMDTKVKKTNTKTKRVVEETLLQERFKKLRTTEVTSSEPNQEQPTEEPKELSEEDLKEMLEIVPVEETKAEALQVKYPIVDWEIYTEGSRKYWKIIRVGNITEAYQGFEDMLKRFDREDLDTLWSLVKERFRAAEPSEDMEKALWVELKRLFEPDKDDVLWKLQRYMHDPLTWRLYGSSVVHHVFSTRGHDIYMLTEKDYPLTTAVMGLMLSRRLQVE